MEEKPPSRTVNRCFARFCFYCGWISVQVFIFEFASIWAGILIHASFDSVFILGGFGFRNSSILGPFWVQFGTILAIFWIHFGSNWGPWRGPVEEKLPSRTEDRWDILADPHLKRFWAQKDAARRPKIH